MRVLVGWDDPTEAETITLILDVDDTDAKVTNCGTEFAEQLEKGSWDVVLLSLNFPDEEEAFRLFEKAHQTMPHVPVIGAWKPGELARLARFISVGLYSHILRDENGDFIFLLPTMIEAAYRAAQAQRARILAERLREEVDSVRRLQESVIPHNLPAPPGYKVVARYEPSQIRVLGSNPVVMAGGDYYDVFTLDANKMILLIGDASGHGVKACMSIMTMHTLIRMIRDQKYANTVDFVTAVNKQLCSSEIVQDQGGFITLLYSTLDLPNHTLRWTSAGQPMPLLQDLATNEVRMLGTDDEAGLPLAIEEDWVYEECEAVIPPNSRLLIYTDGLDEAFPADGDQSQQFGMKGIIRTMQDCQHLSLEETMDRLFADSNAATLGAGRHDDTSVLLLERRESPDSSDSP
ncbi:MAG: fused response regulator/phosphatase [Planctomycetales bacterium]|nr:fused response regulator/phosphatase [Planctomycetales bacterium]